MWNINRRRKNNGGQYAPAFQVLTERRIRLGTFDDSPLNIKIRLGSSCKREKVSVTALCCDAERIQSIIAIDGAG